MQARHSRKAFKLPDCTELEPMTQATAMQMHPKGSAYLGLVNLRVLNTTVLNTAIMRSLHFLYCNGVHFNALFVIIYSISDRLCPRSTRDRGEREESTDGYLLRSKAFR